MFDFVINFLYDEEEFKNTCKYNINDIKVITFSLLILMILHKITVLYSEDKYETYEMVNFMFLPAIEKLIQKIVDNNYKDVFESDFEKAIKVMIQSYLKTGAMFILTKQAVCQKYFQNNEQEFIIAFLQMCEQTKMISENRLGKILNTGEDV